MRERPITFSGPLVRALLGDHKTQTRRLVRKRHASAKFHAYALDVGVSRALVDLPGELRQPYGVPGDRLWVRETHALALGAVFYRATCADDECDFAHPDGSISRVHIDRWRVPMYMKREWSRALLEVVSARVERLRDITEEDAIAEGMAPHAMPGRWSSATELPVGAFASARQAFVLTWDGIHAKEKINDWKNNPWVWRVEFRRIG